VLGFLWAALLLLSCSWVASTPLTTERYAEVELFRWTCGSTAAGLLMLSIALFWLRFKE
jgi:hypothetical protein